MTTVYETMRIRDGGVPFLERHLERLDYNCRAMGLPLPTDAREKIGDACGAGTGDDALRMEWDGDYLTISVRPIPSRDPLVLVTASMPHPGYRIKVTDREVFDRARKEAHAAGAHEALLLTDGGVVAEGTLFGLGWFEGEVLRVPSLDLDILPGIGRARVIEVARELGIPVEEGAFPLWELVGRPAFAVTGTRGVFRIKSLDGASVPQDPRIDQLAESFWPQPPAS